MRRSEAAAVALLCVFFAAPTCREVLAPVDAIESAGTVKVPVTTEAATGYKILEGAKEINKIFKPEQVEKHVFDAKLDLPSQARLLGEFRCFGSWRRQHDFYRKVIKDHGCAYLRHRAVQMLEFDACNEATVVTLAEEYERSLYPETKIEILKRLATSKDKRAVAVVERAQKALSKVMAKAAAEAKVAAASRPCVPQDPTGKPYYGYLDVAGVCEGEPEESNVLNAAGAATDVPGDDGSDQSKGGVRPVKFGK